MILKEGRAVGYMPESPLHSDLWTLVSLSIK